MTKRTDQAELPFRIEVNPDAPGDRPGAIRALASWLISVRRTERDRESSGVSDTCKGRFGTFWDVSAGGHEVKNTL